MCRSILTNYTQDQADRSRHQGEVRRQKGVVWLYPVANAVLIEFEREISWT